MLPVTSIFAALAVFFYIKLAFGVIRFRRTNKVSLGNASDATLETRIRQHGNFGEYVPLAVTLMAIAEFQGAPKLWLILLGIAILGGRLCHVYGLDNMRQPIGLKMRTVGMVSMFMSLTALSITLILQTLFGQQN